MKKIGNNSKWCCYLCGLFDIICFVGGAYLLSIAIFGSCCGASSCNCGALGLPLIMLGYVVRSWRNKGLCCCCNTNANSQPNGEVETTE